MTETTSLFDTYVQHVSLIVPFLQLIVVILWVSLLITYRKSLKQLEDYARASNMRSHIFVAFIAHSLSVVQDGEKWGVKNRDGVLIVTGADSQEEAVFKGYFYILENQRPENG